MLKRNVIIAKGTRVGPRSSIGQSAIGQDCVIGADVSLTGVYLMDNVCIGDNCTLSECMLDDGVVIKSGTSISDGSILASGVRA